MTYVEASWTQTLPDWIAQGDGRAGLPRPARGPPLLGPARPDPTAALGAADRQHRQIFRGGKRVACHRRAAPGDMGTTTLNDHMPASHRRHAELTPQMLRERAGRIGPSTAILVDVILRDRPHPEQGFAPASASCSWREAMVRSGSRPPATGRS